VPIRTQQDDCAEDQAAQDNCQIVVELGSSTFDVRKSLVGVAVQPVVSLETKKKADCHTFPVYLE
jgi:hypothetical protein